MSAAETGLISTLVEVVTAVGSTMPSTAVVLHIPIGPQQTNLEARRAVRPSQHARPVRANNKQGSRPVEGSRPVRGIAAELVVGSKLVLAIELAAVHQAPGAIASVTAAFQAGPVPAGREALAALGAVLVASTGAAPEPAVRAALPARVAGQEVAADAVGAAGGGGKVAMIKENEMTTRNSVSIAWYSLLATLLTLVFWALGIPCRAQTESQQTTAPANLAMQRGFASPKEAANALVQATDQFDVPLLKEILGPDGEALVTSKDTVEDKNRAAAFAAEAKKNLTVSTDSKNPNHATVNVGNEDWPLPIPIVKRGTKWYFDSKAGKQEILARRIGENELNAITICRGFDEAQHEYASEIHDNSGVNQYAQKIISTPGKHDGLAWQNPDGTWGGPVGEGVAKAIAEGYSSRTQPFHGYYFKVLKGQGPATRLGQLDYVINGAMIGGFGLVAWPAEYRLTGVQTFIVSYDGVVYQKDLGPDTTKIAEAMERYNPDKTWHETDDTW
jgi:hypothetical protein